MRVRKILEVEIADLGDRIERARKSDGRSLVDICALAGMTPANWYHIEGGHTRVLPESTLRRIESALNTNFDVHFKEEGDRNG